jgi:hypothetical protein
MGHPEFSEVAAGETIPPLSPEPGRIEVLAPRPPHRRRCTLLAVDVDQVPASQVLLGFQVRAVGDEHLAVGLLPHRLGVGGRRHAAGELPHARSNHFAVERVDLFYHRFGYRGRVEVVGEVASNQILWHDLFSLGFCGLFPMTRFPFIQEP